MSESRPSSLADRRDTGERRRYNRRSAPDPGSPPYYEVFERIAVALESIAAALLPDDGPIPPPRGATRRGQAS